MYEVYIARYVALDGTDHFLEFKDLSEAIKEMFLFESLGCHDISVTDLSNNEYYSNPEFNTRPQGNNR